MPKCRELGRSPLAPDGFSCRLNRTPLRAIRQRLQSNNFSANNHGDNGIPTARIAP